MRKLIENDTRFDRPGERHFSIHSLASRQLHRSELAGDSSIIASGTTHIYFIEMSYKEKSLLKRFRIVLEPFFEGVQWATDENGNLWSGSISQMSFEAPMAKL